MRTVKTERNTHRSLDITESSHKLGTSLGDSRLGEKTTSHRNVCIYAVYILPSQYINISAV